MLNETLPGKMQVSGARLDYEENRVRTTDLLSCLTRVGK